MSKENVEVVRLVNEAFNRGDVAAMLECLDPHCEWWSRADDLEPEVIRGRDATAARFADMDASANVRVELEECIDVGEFVVVAVHLVGRGRASGATFEERQAQTYRVRNGRIAELRIYHEMSDALEAVGLSEQDAHADS